MKITNIQAQELLDSRGNPTVECTVMLENGISASAMVPSGASTGKYESLELRDGEENRYLGKGVLKAVESVNTKIAQVVIGMDVENQTEVDQAMIALDGTENKSELGANAILSVSMACTRAAALSKDIPLYEYIANLFSNPTDVYEMPVPMINMIEGGKHADSGLDIQEYMIMPIGATNIQQAIRWGSEVFHHLGDILKHMDYPTAVGYEGGYAPKLESNEKPFELIVQAIKEAGLKPGEDVSLAIDAAASEFYNNGTYELKIDGKKLDPQQLVNIYANWIHNFPIISIEDGLAEDDWEGFKMLENKLPDNVMNVGDDLFVTNINRLEKGIEMECASAILVKLNQIGTVSETINAIKRAEEVGFNSIISHRSGETEDTFIADFAVGSGVGFIKTGSMSRSERVVKYNRLMRIERELS
jgi:enolase